jgi:hypothetical protein
MQQQQTFSTRSWTCASPENWASDRRLAPAAQLLVETVAKARILPDALENEGLPKLREVIDREAEGNRDPTSEVGARRFVVHSP